MCHQCVLVEVLKVFFTKSSLRWPKFTLSLACPGCKKFAPGIQTTSVENLHHRCGNCQKASHLCCVYHPQLTGQRKEHPTRTCVQEVGQAKRRKKWPKPDSFATNSERSSRAECQEPRVCNWGPESRRPDSRFSSLESQGGGGQKGNQTCPRSRTTTSAGFDAIRLLFRFGFGFRRTALAATRVLKFPLAEFRISCRRLVGSFAYKSISAPVIGPSEQKQNISIN